MKEIIVFQVDKVSFSPDNQLVFAASYKVSLLQKQEQESPESELSEQQEELSQKEVTDGQTDIM